MAGAGWSGALTFPRELSVADGRLISTPAAELGRLRGAALRTQDQITARAFEINVECGLRLSLVGRAGQDQLVDEPGRVRALIDGSMIEVFGHERTPKTLRAYPDAETSWLVESAGDLEVHQLQVPAPEHRDDVNRPGERSVG